MRKMASIRTIKEIRAIAGADMIELAIIDGWQVVVKKGDHVPGEQVVYLEIDSWVPATIAPFLTKGAKEPRVYEGVPGERLRTIKLRGEWSQGLVLPLSVIPREAMDAINDATRFKVHPIEQQEPTEIFSSIDGWDVTDALGVKKWEPVLAANMRGNARRYFPNFVQKTDQERVQNMLRTLEKRSPDEVFECTLKMDGSSTTFYVHPNDEGVYETGVCSRNLELKTDDSNAENLFVQMYRKLEINHRLLDFAQTKGRSIALQGELWGAGINGNWEGVAGVNFSVFDVFDCERYRYVDSATRRDVLDYLNRIGFPVIEHVPVIGVGTMEDFGLGSLKVEDFLAFAERPSVVAASAEGVVFKSLSDPNFSFKVISNTYLVKKGKWEDKMEVAAA